MSPRGRPRTHRWELRLSDQEAADLDAVCHRLGVTDRAEALRLLVARALVEREPLSGRERLARSLAEAASEMARLR